MSKINAYSSSGKTKTSINVAKELQSFTNINLLYQAIHIYRDRLHLGLAKTKTRGEVWASSAKIWRQKGTGRARHGDIAAPIFVGGGVTHGPKGIKKILRIPKRMAGQAMLTAINMKIKEGKLVLVKSFSNLNKTKDAKEFLDLIIKKELEGKMPNKITLIIGKDESAAQLAFGNIKRVNVIKPNLLNAYKIYFGGLIILEQDILEQLNKLSKKYYKKEVIQKEETAKKHKVKKITKNIRKNKNE